ncbi:Glyoxalase-like domain-containing protein [Pseudarthrobacter enclensis]|uniref:Glyoxalase n=1 Tax=Pseudarthrobacter enclensis TaxID=993070 RepID=A0A0V8IPR8_9MICC|nr:VOC family protein [Pseudarthrobacter enclensis]KSU76673.1 glyoxalase [Pseudarthrobacter enclensis]SCC00718.1 Glyoxalase-like domain-containing protein [Pseudarthrobacter enclensis]
MLTIGTIVLGVNDVARSTDFWHAALGYVPREPGDGTWVTLAPASGPGALLSLMLSETPVQDHPRIHLDLYAEDQAAEVERLVSLGARRVDWDLYPDDPDFIVLEDPDSNRFCVIDRSGA